MGTLRSFLARHRALAMVLIAAALCLKALVPAGYMIAADTKVLTLEICADSLGRHISKQIVVPAAAQPPGTPANHDKSEGKGESTCPYSVLSLAALGGADPLVLALALAFVLALGFAAVAVPRAARQLHLRPPLRGPPARA